MVPLDQSFQEREKERQREIKKERERQRELLKCHKDGGTFHKRKERNEIRGVGGKIPSNKRRKKVEIKKEKYKMNLRLVRYVLRIQDLFLEIEIDLKILYVSKRSCP